MTDSRIPLLILSDSPSASSGLGRITRDLATRIHEHLGDVFRLGTVGYGGSGSSKFGWTDYHLHSIENWLPVELPGIWSDFSGDQEGIFMNIWDLSRFWWVNHPQAPPHMRQWFSNPKMKKWLYHPVDATGPNGNLSIRLQETMKSFDRVLDYSEFSCKVTGNKEHLPHGIDTSVFHPYDHKECKFIFRQMGFNGLEESDFLVGIVATNQTRKDWGLGLRTCRELLDRGVNVKLWCHVDVLERFWSLPNLITDYGLQGRVVITNTTFTDEQMARFYSACDVCLSIGLGEGFGFPTYEAISCGTPVVAGNYCGSEWLDPESKVDYKFLRAEGPYSCYRPVYTIEDWADRAQRVEGTTPSLPEEIDWNGSILWPAWKEWLLKGIR